MLEASWEIHATNLSNAPTTDDFIEALHTFTQTVKIDLSKPSHVVYARDTRPSGAPLVSALEDGLRAIGADGRNAGVTTTPILHYLVKAINTKGTPESYGVDSEEGYYNKLSDAFKNLVVCVGLFRPPLHANLFVNLGGQSITRALVYRLCQWRWRPSSDEIVRIPWRHATISFGKHLNHNTRCIE